MGKHPDYDHWHGTNAWKKRRAYQIQLEPWCVMCAAKGQAVAARVADHIVPHKGDYNSYMLGKLQSLCAACHDSKKRLIELKGFHEDCDEHGWPLDRRHPTNLRAKTHGTTRASNGTRQL